MAMVLQISVKYIKELRDKTGAGVMDCKQALQDSKGNIDGAIENLRKRGLTIANKKASRTTIQGLIESYIHLGSKIGILVEINCETDFVARRLEFQALAKNIAMQIAASPNVRYVDISNIPQEVIINEKVIESKRKDLLNKSESMKKQIIEERLEKKFIELTLLSQPFIRDSSITIKDLIKQHIALLGENIKVSRFSKFILGETSSLT